MDARFQKPPVHGIKNTGHETERVTKITERAHKSARMTKPNATASTNLNKRIIVWRKIIAHETLSSEKIISNLN